MLKSIEISNFIFIKHIKINLTSGFNVITGETGAGKSIFLNALGLTLGEKIPADIIRHGSDYAKVTSTFFIGNRPKLIKKITTLGLEIENNYLVLTRAINQKGKSKCFVKDQQVNLTTLKKVAKNLIDMHSQHQNLNLLKSWFYISYLDRYLGIEDQLRSYRKNYLAFLNLQKELTAFLKEESKLQEEKEFLEFTIKELKDKIISEKDYDILKNQLTSLEEEYEKNKTLQELTWKLKDQIIPGIESINYRLENQAPISDDESQNLIKKNLKIIDYFEQMRNLLQSEGTRGSKNYQEAINSLNKKLAYAENLKRKYGVGLDQLDKKLENAEDKIARLNEFSEKKKKIIQAKKSQLTTLVKEGISLHLARKKGVEKLVADIEKEISVMGMENSKVDFLFARDNLSFEENEIIEEHLNENGFDELDLVYAAAKESKFKPLKEIASGGEMSRIMLSLKVLLSKKLPNNTIIFDEIDSGIGGETALKVGEKIKSLSQDKQVLIITHLPQIAKFAHSHFKVEKIRGEKTEVKILALQEEEIIQEISRMLGSSTSKTSLKLAREYKEKNNV